MDMVAISRRTSPLDKISINSPAANCAFCSANNAVYTCPKCAKQFCGVECYRGREHLVCSEEFYRANVEAEWTEGQSHDEESRVHRLVEEYRSNVKCPDPVLDEESGDIQDRMEGVDLAGASFDELWSRLTEDEKADFIRLAETEDAKAGKERTT